jgi:hypothetical protein
VYDLTNNYASRDEAINASYSKSSSEQKDDDKGDQHPSSMKKKDRKHKGDLVDAADMSSNKQKQKPNKFLKMTNSPYLNHRYTVTHLAKDCTSMKKLFIGQFNDENAKKGKKDPPADDEGNNDYHEKYLEVGDMMLIFSGLKVYGKKSM